MNPGSDSSFRRFIGLPRQRLRVLLLLAGSLLLCGGKPSEEVQLSVTTGEGGTLSLRGSFEVDAPVRLVWGILTDYERLDALVSSIERSQVLSRRGSAVLLDQEAVGRVLLFSRRLRIQLEIQESPPHRIAFQDRLRRDFELYRGEWRLQPRAGGVRVYHEITARPSSSVPQFIITGAFEASARELLQQVRTEIVRRAGDARATHAEASTR